MRGWWLCLMALAGVAWADDSWMGCESGAPYPVSEHPTILMVREDVDLYLPSMRVEARFVFRNEGPSCTVRMGFPETGGGEGGNGDIHPQLSRFQSRVDGRRLRRTWIQTKEPNGQLTGYWVAKVRFGRGQTRVVTDSFTATGSSDSSNHHSLDYILTSGANWKGPIGFGRIVCHLQDHSGWVYDTTPASHQTPSGHLVYEFTQIDPKENFHIDWVPQFTCLTINGRTPVPTPSDNLSETYRYAQRAAPPRMQGQRVYMSLREAAARLRFKLDAWDKPNGCYVEIRRDGRLLQLREGSDTVLVDGRLGHLREPLRRQNGWMRICLQDLVDCFGGTWHWDADPWGLVIDLPSAVGPAERAR